LLKNNFSRNSDCPAYFLDHDARSYELIARVFAGGTEGLTRDDVLDNITLTWLTNTGISGGRLYWENKGASFFAVKNVVVPMPPEAHPQCAVRTR
jgi:hypothetical protein